MAEELTAYILAAERVAALGGTGVIVLVAFAFMTGVIVWGRQLKAMEKDRDFYRTHFLKLAGLAEQELK